METNMDILVTGCTSGIGEAVTLLLLKSGFRVYGLVRDNSRLKDEVLLNCNFSYSICDITDSHRISDVFDQFRKNSIVFTGAVFAAGIEESLPLKFYKEENLMRIFETNVFSQFYLLRELVKKGVMLNEGSIVTISSVMSILGQPGKTGYCASKSAILGLVKAASLELAPRNIRVNAVSPGVVDTPMTAKLFKQITPENEARIRGMHPLGIGSVESVAGVVHYLLSPISKWTTGQNIIVDGGYSVQ